MRPYVKLLRQSAKMSKDFSGAGGQENSCTLDRLKSRTECESLESRTENRNKIVRPKTSRSQSGSRLRCAAAAGRSDDVG